MAATDSETDRFEKLKTLLIGDALTQLQSIDARTKSLDAYVGDKSRLEAATADILVEALRKAEIVRHKELAHAIAPVVVAAIQAEIRNSKDMMVEALYPITGRLVTAAVANAFRDMVETINQRIDAMVSANAWRLRLRAVATGRTMAEVALAEADAASLKRALLLERGSGRLLAAWPDQSKDEDQAELKSGLIAAITEFAATVYADKGGELRMLDLGSSHVFLRASPRVIVAAEFAGELTSARERRLDEAFLRIVEAHDSDQEGETADSIGATLSSALNEEERKAASQTPAKIIGLVLAGLAIWAAYGPVKHALSKWRIDQGYATAMSAQPGLADFPLRLDIDHESERVVLRGLVPDAALARKIADDMAQAAKPYKVEPDVKEVALAPSDADKLREQLNEAKALVDGLRAEQAAPAMKLRQLIENFAVFFTEQDTIVDLAAVAQKLDIMAELLKETGAEMRVVGYADETGTLAVNQSTSRRRAQKVASLLIERGVAPEKLAIAPRATLSPISDVGQGLYRNRRVVFERPYEGEFAIR